MSFQDYLYWQRVRLVYKLTENALLPRFKASMLRGLWGHALRAFGKEELYEQLFECTVSEDHPFARRFRKAPNPYILHPPSREETKRTIEVGDRLEFELTLIGQACETLPQLVPVWEYMGGLGMGKGRARMELTEAVALVEEKEKERMFQALAGWGTEPVQIQLQFHTPVRIRSKGKSPQDLSLDLLAHRLVERQSLLAHFHCGAPLHTDYDIWKEVAQQAHLSYEDLRWHSWPRYSNRSRMSMALDGWKGTLIYQQVSTQLLPLFRMGEILHLGKATTFGMGGYSLHIKSRKPQASREESW